MQPLHFAATVGHLAILKRLVSVPQIDTGALDALGHGAFYYSFVKGYEIMSRLLCGREDVYLNSRDRYAQTPLHHASENGHSGIVKLLLRLRAVEVNARDHDEQTPLMLAVNQGDSNTGELLLKCPGVDANVKTKGGWTTFMDGMLHYKGHEGVGKTLLRHPGFDANGQTELGWTALIHAASNGHEEVVDILLQAPRTDLSATGKDWMGNAHLTAVGHAHAGGHENVAEKLDKAMPRQRSLNLPG
ncbi:ankyrin [Lindgomyces ingoldianus]|uniref:Ankyrin n=1 Tax=Lindgomyces ingoldianus TaxID=673940 RepID=A0ACB6RC87_9PLEO|nr:ankyrin [Lindgomyces ingoldianus]KAF2476928.1 ankyrin [Lindgomyces ingoldianus]